MSADAVILQVTDGPHRGREFAFTTHDTFLVGRASDAHFQLNANDPYFSRRHFLLEINPPRLRVLDLKSRNGTMVNGKKIEVAELRDGDEIRAGHTVFRISSSRFTSASQTGSLAPPGTLVQGTTPETLNDTDTLTIPGYQLQKELGRGGMGIVYRGKRLSDKKVVAIKTIIPAMGTANRHADRFIREAEIQKTLVHPNVVAVHDIGEYGNMIYLVMEFVDGPDAEAVLKKQGTIPYRTAVRIICLMLSGLGHAHSMGFVHRDIKPANILIGGRKGHRTVKLADFGLARMYESSELSGLTMQGDMCGTPAFMAPEQVTHYRDVKPAADQYSAAASLYRMITGEYVHNLPKPVVEQLIHILTEPVVPIQKRVRDIPPKLASIIHKALCMEPKDRYPDVLAFRDALARFT